MCWRPSKTGARMDKKRFVQQRRSISLSPSNCCGVGVLGVSPQKGRNSSSKALKGLVFILALLVFWPWLDNPLRYVTWKDRLRTSTPVALIFGAPCSFKMPQYTEYRGGPECYRYDPPRRYRGVWSHEFEGSYFYEGPQKLPKLVNRSGLTWLQGSADPFPTEAWMQYRLLEIEFIGRRTSVPSRYGHGGLSRYEIQIDQVIAFKPLSPRVIRRRPPGR